MIAISLRPTSRKWGTVSFASTLHLCPVLDLLVADVPLKWQPDVRLGLQEALVNAAKHGNNLDPSKTILVEFFVLEDQHWWVISDQGNGFVPSCSTNLDDSKTDINDIDECGRGLYILHQIFDQVHWNGAGTELRLCKQVRSRTRQPLVR
ncbi:anti-sigma regulatory factor [Leptolyngbya sp. NK1-12]|uniref:Anti-sigma regulatory factor n=1 Tax=Leptolyngbya sp. NK1-12 TaxID=2547451 RepID=A0AA96WIP1_9CYAN|nr:anti-sigma regulatory factor [Leptolyngbya sp. NK1-12]WNZ22091.1 anti-sigma regulatory factor [Leptolyngbya sp. NK1-12]